MKSSHARIALASGLLVAVIATIPAGSADGATKGLRTAPLIRGTLWWLAPQNQADWSRSEYEAAIGKQRDIGFRLLWILNAPALYRQALESRKQGQTDDILEWIYEIADAKKMQVIVDLPKGGWHGKTSAEKMTSLIRAHARKFHARYGHHQSFYGWYLNHEINPLEPDEKAIASYWRKVWHDVSETCHEVAPKSKVTISPFFLLDRNRLRGFVYLTPKQYAAWWEETLRKTHIDILMLQDSGEHLSFFTLDDREPFFAAVAEACRRAGAEFWVNVETGECQVANWDEYIEHEKKRNMTTAVHQAPWRFTPMNRLEQKLLLAARYGDNIVNWGYFPFMDPMANPKSKHSNQTEAYRAYKAYYKLKQDEP